MTDLKNLVVAPSVLFQSLQEKPTWLPPFLVVSIVGIAVALLMQPVQAQIAAVRLQDALPPDQIESAIQRTKRFGIIGISLFPLVTLLRWSIIGVLLLLLTSLFTDKLKFKQSFSIVGYTSLCLALGAVVNMGAVYLRGLEVVTSPYDLWVIGLNFWSIETLGLPLYLFLSEITVFSVWYVGLVALGLKYVADLSKPQAVFVSILLWLLGVGYKIGMALIGSRFSPAS